MAQTLVRHGDGLALVIDPALLDSINATENTPFEVVSDGRSLRLMPVRDPEEEKRFEDAVEMVHERFGDAMRKLAS